MGVPLNPSILSPAEGIPWPKEIGVPGYGSVALIQPSSTYPAGQGLAVMWTGGAPLVSETELLSRAQKLGSPWYAPGWPGIGVVLSSPTTGAQVVDQLSGGNWQGVIPVVLSQDLLAAGKLLAGGKAAAGDLVDSFSNIMAGAGSFASIASGLAKALPWIIVGGAALVLGVIVYKVVK